VGVVMPTLDKILEKDNVAEILGKERLEKLGEDVVNKTIVDMESRKEWLTRNKEALKLASMVKEGKNFPWPDSANVKYPLITMAAIQFHARASQSLLSAARPVKAKKIGSDPDGKKSTRAELVSKHMSHQVLHEMPQWQDENDRLLLLLAIIGLAYKKQYRCPLRNKNISELVTPHNLVVNYHAKDFTKCRKTEVYTLTKNDLIERIRLGIFLKVDVEKDLIDKQDDEYEADTRDKVLGIEDPVDPLDDATPYRLFDQHHEWDLDGDGYAEPYIVTVEETSRKVLRIQKRYTEDLVFVNEQGEVYRIEEDRMFTRYIFIPETSSPIYAFGLGTLLNPLNESVNTLLNQLIDAGTLSTLQGGFIGRGIRLPKGGATRFRPGEWKVVQTTGDDLRKGLFPLPVKEPSNVLFQLLGLLIQAGEEISSVADLMKGESPGQNQPFSTTAAVLEQGMQVFTSIYKRLFRSFRDEYKNLYKLNGRYLGEAEYIDIVDPISDVQIEVSKYLYTPEGVDIGPEADPDVMSQTQRQLKAESLLEKVMAGLKINPDVVTRRLLEAEGHEDINELMEYEAPPDPEMVHKMQELELKRDIEWSKVLLQAMQMDVEEVKDSAQAIAHLARAENFKESSINERLKIFVDMAGKSDDLDSKEAIEELKAETAKSTARMKPSAGNQGN
jgi:chaperonin GroES